MQTIIIVLRQFVQTTVIMTKKRNAIEKLSFFYIKIKNGCISTLVSSYHVAASFITSKFLGHNIQNEEVEKSRVLQNCRLTHITLIIITIIIVVIIIIIKNNNNNIQIGKRQLHLIRLDHVLFDLNKLSKDTAFIFTFTPFSSVKLTASKNI